MNQVAEFILENQNKYNSVCFMGNVGAGKTTLIKLLANKMKINDTIQSPTFGYVNIYDNKVYHFDCYRLNTINEALDFGIEEYLDNKNFNIWIEWPEIIESILPKPYLIVKISHTENNTRNISIKTA